MALGAMADVATLKERVRRAVIRADGKVRRRAREEVSVVRRRFFECESEVREREASTGSVRVRECCRFVC